jgi:ABC-2 type transport system ATP-binding protein
MSVSQASAAIRVENLTKQYKGIAALDGVSFEVPVGSVFGLLGENGAGKSTTIKSILGLVQPDSGKVETLGLDPARHGIEVRRKVGYVPETPGLYDGMTVMDIGWFAAGFHHESPGGIAGFEARYNALTAGFDLPPRRKIRALSKGMRAKVGLALALAGEPALLVLDEPTSGLDVLVRREFLESMVDLAGEGRTVFLSSHQIGEVERVASHVALLDQGRLKLVEPLESLKGRTFVLRIQREGYAMEPGRSSTIEVIDAAEGPRQAVWLVHAPSREVAESARDWPGVLSLEVETPSLEEIAIGYLRGRKPEPAGNPVAATIA